MFAFSGGKLGHSAANSTGMVADTAEKCLLGIRHVVGNGLGHKNLEWNLEWNLELKGLKSGREWRELKRVKEWKVENKKS